MTPSATGSIPLVSAPRRCDTNKELRLFPPQPYPSTLIHVDATVLDKRLAWLYRLLQVDTSPYSQAPDLH